MSLTRYEMHVQATGGEQVRIVSRTRLWPFPSTIRASGTFTLSGGAQLEFAFTMIATIPVQDINTIMAKVEDLRAELEKSFAFHAQKTTGQGADRSSHP